MMDFTHLDSQGASRMVDVGDKSMTRRSALASGRVRMAVSTWQALCEGKTRKGAVLEVARLAGIMAAKKTGDLIPLCHPLSLDAVNIDFYTTEPGIVQIVSAVQVNARTGVEMEALTAVAVAALTIYDMCKAMDREMVIEAVVLEEKIGGRSGHFRREAGANSQP